MSIKISSRKAKARKLQDFVRDVFRDIFKSELEDDDIKSAIMGESGVDLKFSPQAKKIIPFDFEIKHQEKFNINESIKQANINSPDKNRIPTIVFSKNRDDVYIALKFVDLMKLLYPNWDADKKINKKSLKK